MVWIMVAQMSGVIASIETERLFQENRAQQRAALPEDQRAEFDAECARADAVDAALAAERRKVYEARQRACETEDRHRQARSSSSFDPTTAAVVGFIVGQALSSSSPDSCEAPSFTSGGGGDFSGGGADGTY